jgi:hypothetical protein
MPLILAITALANFPYSKKPTHIFLVGVIALGVLLSGVINISNSKAYLGNKFGPVRHVNVNDTIAAIEEIPEGSIVCQSEYHLASYHYIDQYIVRNNLDWRLYDNCEEADIYLLRENDVDYSTYDDTQSPKVRAVQFYKYLYAPPRILDGPDEGWQLWKEAGRHKIYIRD